MIYLGQNPKVCVITMSNGSRPFYQTNKISMQKYCKKHDYDWKEYINWSDSELETHTLSANEIQTLSQRLGRSKLFRNTPYYFHKPQPYILKMLCIIHHIATTDYDYVLWLDDSCFVTPQCPNLYEYLSKQNKLNHIVGLNESKLNPFSPYVQKHCIQTLRNQTVTDTTQINTGVLWIPTTLFKQYFTKQHVFQNIDLFYNQFPQQTYIQYCINQHTIPYHNIDLRWNDWLSRSNKKLDLTSETFIYHLKSGLPLEHRVQYANTLYKHYYSTTMTHTKTIAIHMKSLKRSFWSNGMIQHAFFQAKLFHQLGYKVIMISPEVDSTKEFDFVEQVMEGWLTRNLYWIKSEQDVWKELDIDLFILWETNISETILNDIKTRFECPIIAMQCGNEGFKLWNEYHANTNSLIQSSLNHKGTFRYDVLWTLPHYDKFKTLYDSIYSIDTKIVPYVWEPSIIEPHMSSHTPDVIYKHIQNTKESPIVSVCEPNRDITKMSLYPILGSRQIPDSQIHVYGKQCDAMMQHLDVTNVTYQPRTPIFEILQSTTIVVSHQIMNELNYLHVECAWFGTPIIHNSPMLKEIGWYYPDHQIDNIPMLWNQIKSLSQIEYLKKVSNDRNYIRKNLFTNRKEALSYFKTAVETLC